MVLKAITLYEVSEEAYSLTFKFDMERSMNVLIAKGSTAKDVVRILLDIVRSMLYFIEEKRNQ